MARQASNIRRGSPGHNGKPLAGAAILDSPAMVASETLADDRLQQEILRLVEAAREGRLSERGRVEQFEGNNRKVLDGVNTMLDAILLPIEEGNRIISLLRGGNLRERVEIACKGDHELMKTSVNGVQSWLTDLITYITKIANGDLATSMAKASGQDQIHEWLVLLKTNIEALVTDSRAITQAAGDGKLGIRSDVGRHQGAYRKIIEGFN